MFTITRSSRTGSWWMRQRIAGPLYSKSWKASLSSAMRGGISKRSSGGNQRAAARPVSSMCMMPRGIYTSWTTRRKKSGCSCLLGNTQLNIAQMQQLDPYTNNNSANPIVYKVWQNSRWKKMYMAHFKTIMEETCENDWFMERAQ